MNNALNLNSSKVFNKKNSSNNHSNSLTKCLEGRVCVYATKTMKLTLMP